LCIATNIDERRAACLLLHKTKQNSTYTQLITEEQCQYGIKQRSSSSHWGERCRCCGYADPVKHAHAEGIRGCYSARLAAHFDEQPACTTTNSEEGGSLLEFLGVHGSQIGSCTAGKIGAPGGSHAASIAGGGARAHGREDGREGAGEQGRAPWLLEAHAPRE
jgi:hypothetical protein